MTEDIEREIDRTRGEISLTLSALERKLAARYLVEKGFDMLQSSDYGLNRGLDMIRSNPIPVALIGIGAAWLIASNTGVVDRIAQDERIGAARRRVGDFASDMTNRAGELASTMAERAGLRGDGAERPLGETGNPMIDRPAATGGGWVHQMSDRAQGAMRSARDSGGAMLGQMQQRAGSIADQVTDTFERNPLLIGAIAALAGAVIGALLPPSRVEDEWFGGKRDELWHRAEQMGQETASRIRNVAVRAADAAADAASDTVKTETARMESGAAFSG